jgi:hypothetical protein
VKPTNTTITSGSRLKEGGGVVLWRRPESPEFA